MESSSPVHTALNDPLTLQQDSDEDTRETKKVESGIEGAAEGEEKQALMQLLQEHTFSPEMMTLVRDALLETVHEGSLQVKVEVLRPVDSKPAGEPTLRYAR